MPKRHGMICNKGIRHIDFTDLECRYKEKYLHSFSFEVKEVKGDGSNDTEGSKQVGGRNNFR